MKLTIADYEVTITARRWYESRNNNDAAAALLNTLSSLADEARKQLSRDGYGALAEYAARISDDTFNALKAAGVYENL